jgi:hypothetical protein
VHLIVWTITIKDYHLSQIKNTWQRAVQEQGDVSQACSIPLRQIHYQVLEHKVVFLVRKYKYAS